MTYSDMVRNLFKRMPGHGAAMLHAAVGIAGESGELRAGHDRKNLIEECGDIEFYIEAAWQSTIAMNYADGMELLRMNKDNRAFAKALPEAIDNVHTLGCDILDHAKKVWVYEDGNRDEKIAPLLVALQHNLSVIYEFIGTDSAKVQDANMAKLLTGKNARYASGTYSNDQALARADKAADGLSLPVLPKKGYEPDGEQHTDHATAASGNGRNFIGQNKS